MRKFFSTLLVTVPLFLMAAACDKPVICEPYSIRYYTNQPDRWWVCNEDGTGEHEVRSLTPEQRERVKNN